MHKNLLKFIILVNMSVCWSTAVSSSSHLSVPVDYHYAGDMKIDPRSGLIEVDWRITVYDDSETGVVFFLRDTLGDIQVTGPGVAGVDIQKQNGFSDFWAIDVKLAEQSGNAPEGHRSIRISYTGVLLPEPMENLINAIEPGRVELTVDSFWFPIDSRFAKFLTADLAVHVGEGWQGVSTGDVTATADGFRIVNTDPRMDIAFAASTSFHVTRTEGFTIYDQRAEHAGTTQLVEVAGQCRDYLNSQFGAEDPLPVARLLITERPSSGYSRENYIAFTDIAKTERGPLTRFVCHEFVHYWSQGAKFDTVDNWLNEAFAEYIGLMAVRNWLGQAAYDQMLASFAEKIAGLDLPPIWRPGDTERGQDLVQYRKGPLVLARLENNIGQAVFLEFVRAYFNSPDKTTPGLLKVLVQVAGPEQALVFESMLAE